MREKRVAAIKVMRDGVLLVRLQLYSIRHAREGEVCAVVLAKTDVVESVIVGSLDVLGTQGILNQKVAEGLLDLFLLHLRLCRELRIFPAFGVAHDGIVLIEAVGQKLDGVLLRRREHRHARRRLRAIFPLEISGLFDLPLACLGRIGDFQRRHVFVLLAIVPCAVDFKLLVNEVLDVLRVQPGRTKGKGDVADRDGIGLDDFQSSAVLLGAGAASDEALKFFPRLRGKRSVGSLLDALGLALKACERFGDGWCSRIFFRLVFFQICVRAVDEMQLF